MTPQEAAAQLDGRQYSNETTKELRAALKESGLVALFGASDDLAEFRGAIDGECGVYGGGTIYLTSDGLLINDCDNDECPHFERLKHEAETIEAIFDQDGFTWIYETEIPHANFIIKEDDENYCQGIVFRLSDVQ